MKLGARYRNKAKPYGKIWFVSAIVIILSSFIGIASRKWGVHLPFFLAEYAGDTMWSLAFFAFFRIILIKQKLITVFIVTLDFSFLIELSQLWHPAFLDAIRHTLPGGLLLGFGFKWTDLICYLSGCLMGWLIFSLTLRQASFSS
jgi:hypothetical protein